MPSIRCTVVLTICIVLGAAASGHAALNVALEISNPANTALANHPVTSGSRDPFFEDDPLLYTEDKQTINSITFGHTFLHEWARVYGRKPMPWLMLLLGNW